MSKQTKMTAPNPKSKKKKGRVIIRNLSFKVTDDILRDTFSKFGEISEIIIPKKSDGKMFGFGFIQFVKTASAIKAINALNAKKILGRPVAIDFAIPKDKFNKVRTQSSTSEQKETGISDKNDSNSKSDDTNEEETFDKKRKKHSESNSKICDSDNEHSLGSDDESGSENSSDSDSEVDDEPPKKKVKHVDSSSGSESGEDSDEESEVDHLSDKGKRLRNDSGEIDDGSKVPLNKKKKLVRRNDVGEGRTLFIRNLSFDTTEEELKDAICKYGDIKYCLLCRDPLTEYPRGTAFVQFVNKEDAEKCLEETNRDDHRIVLGNRVLKVALALSQDDIKKQREERMKKGKDNRNLKLETEGLIRPGSEAAQGVSQTDLAKRLQLEKYKKRLLKNLNYFISPVRLCVHNIPLHLDDAKLRQIFLKAAGPGAVVTECRIMRNLKKLDEKGIGLSKGFGFVGFSKHEHALQALRKLNNNPDTFSPKKRPIVEFSMENRSIINAKKRQFERQKKKPFQKKKADNYQNENNAKMEENKQKFHSKKKKKFSRPFQKKKGNYRNENNAKMEEDTQKFPSKKKKKFSKPFQKKADNYQNENNAKMEENKQKFPSKKKKKFSKPRKFGKQQSVSVKKSGAQNINKRKRGTFKNDGQKKKKLKGEKPL